MPRTLDAFETNIDEYLQELCRLESAQSIVNMAPLPEKRSMLGRLGAWCMGVLACESHLDTLLRKNRYLLSDLMM